MGIDTRGDRLGSSKGSGSRRTLVLCALASGMLLVAVVGWSLVRTAREGRDRAEWAAQRDARDLSLAMLAALRREAILELCDEEQRFRVVQGAIEVDERIGWLTMQSSPQLGWREREGLRQAQVAEFVQHDPVGAAAHFERLLRDASEGQRKPLPQVLAAAAWQQQRAGEDSDRIVELLSQLEEQLSRLQARDLSMPHHASVLASATLLLATRDTAPSAARWNLLAALPANLFRPLFARLRELGFGHEEHAAAHARLAARRQLLVDASRFAEAHAAGPNVQPFADRIALWFADQAGGQGAMVPRAWLASLPGLGSSRPSSIDLPPIPDRGSITFDEALGTAELIPGVAWVAKPALPEVPWFAQPSAILGAGIGLLLLFAGSVWATMRGLSRETAAMRTRTEFLSGVTHELKTPVASMRLIADVLNDDDVPEARQREYFAMLAGESARLSALIENVLDLGQMERGERAYDLRDDDLADVVRDAVHNYAPLANHHGIELQLHQGVAEAPARIDRGAITQALLNLLENARKYAASGARIDVATELCDQQFVARVRDHGPGVPATERERIFTRFQRGEAQQSGAIPGVGLGLFLSRSILARHRGTLTCTAPSDGPGTVFVLTVPVGPAAADANSADSATNPTTIEPQP